MHPIAALFPSGQDHCGVARREAAGAKPSEFHNLPDLRDEPRDRRDRAGPGGCFEVKPLPEGLDATFETESNGLPLNRSCGAPDEEGRERLVTAEDAGGTVVRSKTVPATCAALDREAKPAFAAASVPLRERIASSGWRCLSRAYDKARMAKHKQQQVTAVAVAIKGPVVAEKPAGESPSTLLDVTLGGYDRLFRLDASQDSECALPLTRLIDKLGGLEELAPLGKQGTL